MLEANGVAVHVDGAYHASVQVNSLTLGGHRLRIARADYAVASDLIREVGTADSWDFNWGVQRAVVRFVTFWAIVYVIPMLLTAFVETRSPETFLYAPLMILSVPVNPQGEGDYYLAPPDLA